jgi:hypothetical protein
VVVPEPDGRQRIVVPPGPLRQEICKLFHDEGGHPGGHRTLAAVARYFFWPKMSQEVRAYAASCAACQAAKGSNRLPAGYSEPHNRGLIQVGVNVARSKKKKPSESVRAAGRPGPADPVATTFLYTLCFDLLPRNPVSQKTIHFATQV